VLLILIAVLGLLSMRRMNEVDGVLDLEQQHAAKTQSTTQASTCRTKLDNKRELGLKQTPAAN